MDVPRALGELLPLTKSLSIGPDPLALFAHLRADSTAYRALLESADRHGQVGERSFLITRAALVAQCRGRQVTIQALGPQGQRVLPWLAQQCDQAQLTDDTLTIQYPPAPQQVSEKERLFAPSPTDALRLLSSAWTLLSKPVTPAFLIAGTFSYDFLGVYEELPNQQQDPTDFPDYCFIVPEEVIIINHKNHTTRILSYVFGGPESERSMHDAHRRIEELAKLCQQNLPQLSNQTPTKTHDYQVDIPHEAFMQNVDQLKEHIRAGNVYQIVHSRTFSAPCKNPLQAYACLRKLNPSPYMFYLMGPQWTLFGASPETAVKVSGQPRMVEIKPIAGTRPRGKHQDGSLDNELDSRLELELRLNEKELSEHCMLVDLARNDVARVSKAGTRSVAQLLTVERYSHVMHLVSRIKGQLRDDLDALHAYVATMNMGTLVGAPKIRAATLLRDYEASKRGPYGGAVGYISSDGEMDTAIIIRSALCFKDTAYVRAGAGIVYDSDPAEESHETTRKAAAVLKALGAQ